MRWLAAALLVAGCATVPPPAIVGRSFEPVLSTFDGKPFDWQQTHGKVVLVDVWASWCHACAAALPEMASLQRELEGRPFLYVGIDVDADPRAGQAFLKALGVEGLQTLSDRSARHVEAAVQVRQAPTRLLLDQAGTVRLVQDGFQPGDSARLKQEIEKLLSLER